MLPDRALTLKSDDAGTVPKRRAAENLPTAPRAQALAARRPTAPLVVIGIVAIAFGLTAAQEPRRTLRATTAEPAFETAAGPTAGNLNPLPWLDLLIGHPDLVGLKPAPAEPPTPLVKTVAVGRGDTLMKVLTAAGAQIEESQDAIAALARYFNPRRLKLGQEITLTFERDDGAYRLAAVNLAGSAERQVAATRTDTGFIGAETLRVLERGFARTTGIIDDSLYSAGLEAGLSSAVLAEMIQVFSYDVDFQREIQSGDRFEVFFERYYDDAGKAAKEGRILYAALNLRSQELRYYHYEPSDGEADYFNARGQAARKGLLRTPIDGAKLTSRFGMRNHPILGYSKMHKGVDFGAVTGTPIQAAGDGQVEMAGANGAYGNYVRLRHSSGYATAYAHMSRIAVKPGQRVRQGQVIGYVGSTGRSTGPHLHYEVLANNRQINPLSVRMPTGRTLTGRELQRFQQRIDELETRIAATPVRSQLASD